MKVFLSWSGEVSNEVALAFREWLPSVIQTVTPYVSSEDIDKGARWSNEIAVELEESSFGILCVTPQNINAPWLLFEAGALSKAIDKSYVSPFLLGVKRSDIPQGGPLVQFQSTVFNKVDVKKLISSINEACQDGGLDETRLDKVFDVWWPNLEAELKIIEESIPKRIDNEQDNFITNGNTHANDILEEILQLARNQNILLNTPESVLPPRYFREVIADFGMPILHPAIPEIIDLLERLMPLVMDDAPNIEEIREVCMRLQRPLAYLTSRSKGFRKRDFFGEKS